MAANKNTLAVTGNTLSASHVRKLTRFSKATGYSVSGILDRAVELFMVQEAPVYMAYAKRQGLQA